MYRPSRGRTDLPNSGGMHLSTVINPVILILVNRPVGQDNQHPQRIGGVVNNGAYEFLVKSNLSQRRKARKEVRCI